MHNRKETWSPTRSELPIAIPKTKKTIGNNAIVGQIVISIFIKNREIVLSFLS
jgi:hypothetical protein